MKTTLCIQHISGPYGVGWPDGGHYLTKKETPKGPFTLNTFLLFKKMRREE